MCTFRIGYYVCNKTSKTVLIESFASILSTDDKSEQNVTDDALKELSSVVKANNQTYSFEAKRTNQSNVRINGVLQSWTSDMKFTHYLTFPKQNTICRFSFNYERVVKNENCSGERGSSEQLCYIDPFSNTLSEDFNWTSLTAVVDNKVFWPEELQKQHTFYFDTRTSKATASATAAPTTSTSTTTTVEETSSTDSTVVTSRTTISSSKVTATTKQEVTKKAHSKLTKIAATVKAQKKNSVVAKQSTKTKTPSSQSRSVLFIILFLVFLLCLIGSVVFFIRRSRQQRQKADKEPFLDRVDSDESQKSGLDEDENSTTEVD